MERPQTGHEVRSGDASRLWHFADRAHRSIATRDLGAVDVTPTLRVLTAHPVGSPEERLFGRQYVVQLWNGNVHEYEGRKTGKQKEAQTAIEVVVGEDSVVSAGVRTRYPGDDEPDVVVGTRFKPLPAVRVDAVVALAVEQTEEELLQAGII